MTNETEPRTRRFYVDLSPEQEKVLLKKANHFFCRKRGLPDSKSELTIELFQQLVDLLATAWKERHTVLESFGQQGVRIVRDLATPAAAAAAAATSAAETSAGNKGRRPRVPMSEACVQTRRARLREAADILRASIDEMSGVLSLTGADGGPADADKVLNAVCTHASAINQANGPAFPPDRPDDRFGSAQQCWHRARARGQEAGPGRGARVLGRKGERSGRGGRTQGQGAG